MKQIFIVILSGVFGLCSCSRQHGSYWIGTEDEGNSSKAYRLQFEDNLVSELFTMLKTNYYSVRTVQTAPSTLKLSEYDQPEVFRKKSATDN